MKRYARSFEGDPVSLGYDMSRTQLADSSKAWINFEFNKPRAFNCFVISFMKH